MPRLVDVRRPITAILGAILVCLAFAQGAHAQREFVEEVDKDPLADVDLDAPDPAEADRARKKLDPNARDPKKDPKDAKDLKDPKDAKDAKDPKDVDASANPDAGPGGDVADPASASKDAPFESGSVRILETTLDAFQEKWDVRAATVRKGEVAKAKKLISDVDEALLDFGVQGIPGGLQAPATANALLLEGRRALEEGGVEEATALVDAAERAAPDLVAVHTQRAHVLWTAGDLGGTLNALMHAVKAHVRDPLTMSQLGVRSLALLLAAVVLLAGLLAALAGLPALRLLSFDLLQVLPKGAHGGQVLALVIIAAVAPLVVGAGPVFGALWILSLAWLYLSMRERMITGIVALACLALPFGVDALARLASFPGSRADRAQRAMFDAHAEPMRHALWMHVAPASLNPPPPAPVLPKDAKAAKADATAVVEVAKPLPVLDPKALDALDDYEITALAMWHKREGRLAVARLLLEKVVARNADAAFAHGELGVVNALEGNESVALVELGKALAADPDAHAAAFDASVLHYRGGRTDKAESVVAPVAKGAPDLLNAFRRTTYRAPDQAVTHNRAFVDVYPAPLALFKSGLASSSESQSTEDSIARPLLRGQLGTRAAALLVGFPLAWLVLLALRKKIDPAQGCVRCGHPASRRVDGKDVPADTCSQCFHAFVSTRSRIDAGVKLRKEREIITRRTRLGRAILVLALLFPGAGHLFAGATVRGALFALFHTFGLGALLFASGLVPMPQLAGPWSPTVPLVVCGVIVGVVWLLSLRSAWILSDEASGRGRR